MTAEQLLQQRIDILEKENTNLKGDLELKIKREAELDAENKTLQIDKDRVVRENDIYKNILPTTVSKSVEAEQTDSTNALEDALFGESE